VVKSIEDIIPKVLLISFAFEGRIKYIHLVDGVSSAYPIIALYVPHQIYLSDANYTKAKTAIGV
jgi:hypothetical protein